MGEDRGCFLGDASAHHIGPPRLGWHGQYALEDLYDGLMLVFA